MRSIRSLISVLLLIGISSVTSVPVRGYEGFIHEDQTTVFDPSDDIHAPLPTL